MVRILHLSDFHFRENTHWDSEPLLLKLAEALAKVHQQAPVQLVVITGDIAYSGKPAEYALAAEWLEKWLLPALGGLDSSRLLLVPGNHDVDRTKVSFVEKATQTLLLAKDPNHLDIAGVLKKNRRTMFARFKAYQAFANRFQKRSLPWWHQVVEIDGFKLGFAGLCSAWMSWQNEEQGQLLLGQYQINQVLEGLREADLRIALLHHPESYIKAGEASWDGLRREFQVILSGHLHDTRLTKIEEGTGLCFQLAAGACYGGSGWANAFNLIDVDLGAQRLRVQPWLWQEGRWKADLNRSHPGFSLVRADGLEKGQAVQATHLQAYRLAFAERYSRWDLRMLGAAVGREQKPTIISLDAMYQALRLAKGYDLDNTQKGAIFNAAAVLALQRSLVISGIPGSGKTTWCRHTFRRLLSLEGVLPVMLELRALTGYWQKAQAEKRPINLLDYLREEICAHAPTLDGFPLVEFFKSPTGPRIILLVDGWDEIGEYGELLREKLQALQASCPRLRIIATSRPFGEGRPSHIDGYDTQSIQPLSDEEISAFARRFFECCHGEAADWEQAHAQFIANLRDAPGSLTLARTPLLLTMMLFISRTQVLPDKRHQLYCVCIDNLLKLIPGQQISGGVVTHHVHHWCPDDAEQRLRLVAELAWRTQTSGKARYKAIVVPRSQMLEFLPTIDTGRRESFLNWLVDRAGLLVERSDGTLTFTHLSFQEYLTALHLKYTLEKHKRADEFERLARDQNWWETLRLWAALENVEQPTRVDEMMAASMKDPNQLGLVGAVLADGSASDEAMAEWLWPAVDEIRKSRLFFHYMGEGLWRSSRQEDRKNRLRQALQSAIPATHWLSLVRVQTWGWHAGLAVYDVGAKGSAAVITRLFDRTVIHQDEVAWSRALLPLHPLIPGSPLAWLRLWPSRRHHIGNHLQQLIALGNGREVINRHGQDLVALILEVRTPSDELVPARDLEGDLMRDFAGDMMRDLAGDLTDDLKRDLARDLARDFARGLAGFFAGEFSYGLSTAFMRSVTDYFTPTLARAIAAVLTHDLVYFYSTCFARVEEHFTEFSDFLTLIMLGSISGQRAHLAHRIKPSNGVASILQTASRVSLGHPADESLLHSASADLDPLWPALARHVARCSSDEDRRYLEAQARNPESWPQREALLQWGLQFYVRGDLLFEDGEIVTLDELFDTWGLERLPLLEPFPPDLEIDWKD